MTGDMQNRLRDYLANGGLFNPELMDGPTVRDLLVAFGAAYMAQAAELEKLRSAAGTPAHPGPTDREQELERQLQTERRLSELHANDVQRLRTALCETAEVVGASVNATCSVGFLCDVPKEVALVLRRWKSKTANAEAELTRLHSSIAATRDNIVSILGHLGSPR